MHTERNLQMLNRNWKLSMAIRDHLLTHDIFMHHYTLTQIHIDTDTMHLYRPQTQFAKVMFSQVFVCPQGEGLGLRPEGDLCQGDTPQTETPCTETPPRQRPPPGQRPPLYGNGWAVRILLECILVVWAYRKHSSVHFHRSTTLISARRLTNTHTHARRGTTLTAAPRLSDFVTTPRGTRTHTYIHTYTHRGTPRWLVHTHARTHTHTRTHRGPTLTGARSLSDFLADPGGTHTHTRTYRPHIDWYTHTHTHTEAPHWLVHTACRTSWLIQGEHTHAHTGLTLTGTHIHTRTQRHHTDWCTEPVGLRGWSKETIDLTKTRETTTKDSESKLVNGSASIQRSHRVPNSTD